MYDYSLPNGLPSGSRAVWSRLPLFPLVDGPLTPFSYSLLAEIAGRAWYQYFDRLGFDPMPRARVLRLHKGWAYINLTLSAQRDVEGAAVAPPTLRVDGQPFPICKWEKPGLLAGLKFSLAQGRIDALLKSLAGEIDEVTARAQAWYAKVAELRWTQAEVLQIMEEIEHIGVPSFLAFFAAGHNLTLAYNRLIQLSSESSGQPATATLIDAAVGDPGNGIEQTVHNELMRIGQAIADKAALRAWLTQGDLADWMQRIPDPALLVSLQTFLATHGHRCRGEGETQRPRWVDDPSPLFFAVLAAAEGHLQPIRAQPAQPDHLLETISPNRRKEAQQWLQKIEPLRRLRSQALHAFAYVLAGARRWALAAARDAMVDERLLQLDDAFFFELEQLKEMMTGEWNISSRREIQSTARKRRAEYAQWLDAQPSDLLVGESETLPVQHEPLPSFAAGFANFTTIDSLEALCAQPISAH
ncbi:MAG: hypothetical protein KJZ93_00615 [Caldilineaceae bacterium]|nr:hypothetical protein [Caldilineaceae bacterium]